MQGTLKLAHVPKHKMHIVSFVVEKLTVFHTYLIACLPFYKVVDAVTNRVAAFVYTWVHTQDPSLLLCYKVNYIHSHQKNQTCCCAMHKYTYIYIYIYM